MNCFRTYRLEGIYRQDIYELPPDSIRELIVNAVMNCSYIQVSNIQVAIYDNRLEITSPGGLLSAATIKRTLTKMQHEGKVIREGSNRKGKWRLIDK